ncbi:hypothetical protein FrCorBMG51_12055 [Protofrankia coriariae]|uniref:Uncharacterized protein n=1 Tax=Protofrankia coriariae TaxID=1562887 RepID=A0ABR5F3P2_9ACTN|nr:hypothetical protein FrCorBMG51_12055 [Protofrankia coriariae]
MTPSCGRLRKERWSGYLPAGRAPKLPVRRPPLRPSESRCRVPRRRSRRLGVRRRRPGMPRPRLHRLPGRRGGSGCRGRAGPPARGSGWDRR